MLRRFSESKSDLDELLKLNPSNKAALKELALVKGYLQLQEESNERELNQRQKVNIEEVDSSSDDEESDTGEADQSTLDQQAKLIDKCEARNVLSEADTKHATSSTTECNLKVSKENISADDCPNNKVTCDTSTKEVFGGGKETTDIESDCGEGVLGGQSGRMTPYEFLHAWTSLKKTDLDNDYLNLLLQIEPAHLVKVISNKLDGRMLEKIIMCSKLLIHKGESVMAYSYLHYLTLVPRFQLVSMFMTSDDKQDREVLLAEVRQICEHLEASLVAGEDCLTDLQQAYSV